MAENAPPGWYRAETDAPNIERYWDGTQWSADTRTAIAPPRAPAPPPTGHGQIGKPRSVGLTILVSIVTFGIWPVVWAYMNGEELKVYRPEGIGGVVYALLTLFVYPVTMFLLAMEVENLYVEAGEQPRITTVWGLWFLLPLIGNIVWYVRIQHALNEFWQARGGTMNPGLA